MYNSVRVPAAVPAGDVELKHLLWTLQQQWGASTGAWLEAPFFELDVVDMTEQVGPVLLRSEQCKRTNIYTSVFCFALHGSSSLHPAPAMDTVCGSALQAKRCLCAVNFLNPLYPAITLHCAAPLPVHLQVERVSRQVHRLERGLPPNSLVPRLRDSVAQWQVRGHADDLHEKASHSIYCQRCLYFFIQAVTYLSCLCARRCCRNHVDRVFHQAACTACPAASGAGSRP